jgi:hypothetical protein
MTSWFGSRRLWQLVSFPAAEGQARSAAVQGGSHDGAARVAALLCQHHTGRRRQRQRALRVPRSLRPGLYAADVHPHAPVVLRPRQAGSGPTAGAPCSAADGAGTEHNATPVRRAGPHRLGSGRATSSIPA